MLRDEVMSYITVENNCKDAMKTCVGVGVSKAIREGQFSPNITKRGLNYSNSHLEVTPPL